MKSEALEFQPQIITFFIVVFCYLINGPSYPFIGNLIWLPIGAMSLCFLLFGFRVVVAAILAAQFSEFWFHSQPCLLYTSPSPRDRQKSRMPSSA